MPSMPTDILAVEVPLAKEVPVVEIPPEDTTEVPLDLPMDEVDVSADFTPVEEALPAPLPAPTKETKQGSGLRLYRVGEASGVAPTVRKKAPEAPAPEAHSPLLARILKRK